MPQSTNIINYILMALSLKLWKKLNIYLEIVRRERVSDKKTRHFFEQIDTNKKIDKTDGTYKEAATFLRFHFFPSHPKISTNLF